MLNKDVRKWARQQYRAEAKASRAWQIGLTIGVVVFALLYIANRGNAQDVTFAGCVQADYDALKADVTAQLDTLADDPAAGFVALRGALDMAQGKCTGGVYSHETHPNGIAGPLVLDGTVYELTFTTPEQAMTTGYVEWTTLAGDCGFMGMLSLAGTNGGSETSIEEFAGCEAIFDVTLANAEEWTFSIKKLK